MDLFDLLLIPLFLGLVAFVEPCSLGVNLIFLGYIQGKPKAVRLAQGATFLLVRAFFLALLGVLFGYMGQLVVGFQFAYRPLIGALFVVLGALYLVSRWRPLPMPSLGFLGRFAGGRRSAVALGTVFGLVIPACATPLVLYLLGKTVLKGDMAFGALSMMVFGAGMSLPLLVIASFEGTNRFLERTARSSSPLAYVGGLLLIFLGLAAFSPRAMAAASVPIVFMARLIGLEF